MLSRKVFLTGWNARQKYWICRRDEPRSDQVLMALGFRALSAAEVLNLQGSRGALDADQVLIKIALNTSGLRPRYMNSERSDRVEGRLPGRQPAPPLPLPRPPGARHLSAAKLLTGRDAAAAQEKEL